MAKAVRKKDAKKKLLGSDVLPLKRENFLIIGIGLATIVAGYIAMLNGSIEGFLSLDLAPTLLVLGYCVIIPLGILYKKSYIGASNSGDTKP